MSGNGNKTVEMSTPEPTIPATTNKETRNTRREKREVNFRCGNKGGVCWSEQNDFKG